MTLNLNCADGVVGEVLFWALKRCLGEACYSAALHRAWVKIYSRMLRTIVPVAVSMELKDGSAQVNRLKTYTVDTHINSVSSVSSTFSGRTLS